MSEVPKAAKGEPKDTSTINKIRTENRERKKRWREANEDRNKDNDLRCRVSKRANKLHGKEPSSGGGLNTLGLNSGQFDPNTVKTALALSDFVKKNVSLDLAQLTHVLADPNLAQQLLELERASAATVAAVTSATATSPTITTTTASEASTVPTLGGGGASSSTSMSSLAASLPGLLLSTLKTGGGSDVKALTPAFNQAMDTDYPMDAVLTLMQLNGGWKA
ncbi:MAG: hypothetical protein BYD32DRAFT_232735 [Podila humilis]|nr:MAG: hypothetical protein BYD32DRAFT_232735 [Podila humilis]